MSSSNLVEVIGVPELVYGTTPPLATATAETFRFTSETLSGTPTTVQSQALRTDRMSGGQVVVGLTSGGALNFELAPDPTFDRIFQMAMMSPAWTAEVTASDSATLTLDPTNDQLADVVFATMDITDIDGAGTALAPGGLVILSGYADAAQNGPRVISTVTPPSTVRLVVPRGTVSQAATPVTIVTPAYVEIGATQTSLSLSKAYKDVTHIPTPDEHSQRYTGAIISELAMTITYGQIVTGVATFSANGYNQEKPSLHQQMTAAGGTVDPPGTTNPLNASVDMGMVTVANQPTDYCIESLGFTLNNGLTPQNCIGKIAPTKYGLGTAAIGITSSIYLSDTSYDAFMPAKLSQAPIDILLAASNLDGGYAFHFTALQLSFPDPEASGQNQQVMIAATGQAKVGPNGASSLRIYKWETVTP
jgi:hypothetical protein